LKVTIDGVIWEGDKNEVIIQQIDEATWVSIMTNFQDLCVYVCKLLHLS
jgi:hypothetical protein